MSTPSPSRIIEGWLEVHAHVDPMGRSVTVLSGCSSFKLRGDPFEIYDVTVLDDLIEALQESRAWLAGEDD